MTIWMEWAATSALLILAVVLLRALLGKRIGAGVRYALWGVVLVRLLIPVQIFTLPAGSLPVRQEPPAQISAAPAPWEGSYAVNGDPAPVLTLGPQGEPDVPWQFYDPPRQDPAPAPRFDPEPLLAALGWGWLGGAAAACLAMLVSNLRFSAGLRRRRRRLDSAVCALPVYAAEDLPSPCLFGLFRPAVYVTPEVAARPDMLRHVLAHETTHARHGDHIWSALRCAALAVHWWNPLVWLAAVLSRRDGELACDEGAIGLLGDGERKAYGCTLLTLVTARPAATDLLSCATTMSGGKRALWERVRRIAKPQRRLVWATALAVVMALTVAACAFVGTGSGEAGGPGDGLPKTWRADLDRDGVEETLEVVRREDEMCYELTVTENGSTLFTETAGDSHAGWNTVFLCERDGEDCLLRYVPYMSGGSAGHSYQLFYLDGDGREIVLQSGEMYFDINYAGAMHVPMDVEAAAAFLEDLSRLLEDAQLLMNSDPELEQEHEQKGSWLRCPWDYDEPEGFVYDESLSMEENLRAWSECMDRMDPNYVEIGGKPARLTVYYGEEGQAAFSLTYDGKEARFEAEAAEPAMPQLAAADLDGDGAGELVVTWIAEHLTGIAADGLRVYDAASLECLDVDGAGVVRAMLEQISERRADDDNFYLSAPGMDAVIPKRGGDVEGLEDWEWVKDTIGFGSSYAFTVENGVLCCNMGVFQGHLGSVHAQVRLDEGRPVCSGYLYCPAGENGATALINGRTAALTVAYMGPAQTAILSYDGRQAQFADTIDMQWGVELAGADLDGDGVEEIVAAWSRGHGAGMQSGEVRAFDAATLEELGGAGIADAAMEQIRSTADGTSWYLSAPGMSATVLKDSLEGEKDRLRDELGFGDYVWFTVENGVLYCDLGAEYGPGFYCGAVRVELGMEGGALSCRAFRYVPSPDIYAPRYAYLAYQDVLNGLTPFIFVEDGAPERRTVSDIPALFDPYDSDVRIWQCALVDLDRDGEDEMVLYVCGVSGDMGGHLILHRMAGQVYGFKLRHREMSDLKADGTWEYTDPTGTSELGVRRTAFTTSGLAVRTVASASSPDYGESWGDYTVEGKAASEADFTGFMAKQRLKEDAAWQTLGDASTAPAALPISGALGFEFCSGAGGWQTELTLNRDGTFAGKYSDSDMGDTGSGYQGGTEYICTFHGRFGDARQLSEHVWSLTLEELTLTGGHPVGEEWIEDGVRYVSSGPYGLDGPEGEALAPGAAFMLYAPGATPEETGASDEFYGWLPQAPGALTGWALHNLASDRGFFQNVYVCVYPTAASMDR